MPLLDFPSGDNATDTVIAGVHFNLTTFRAWGYEYYSNGTVSNGTGGWCMVVSPPYTPSRLLDNGSFVDSTWCYMPLNPIGPRAGVGLGFVVLFALAIILNMVNLHRHGRLFLRTTRRFYPIGRRWQWYWSLAACAFAIIGLIANIDVDRFFLPELPIVIVSFFWYLLQMAAMAIVWEAVRHWGSWLERQFIDPDPFVLPEDGRRYKFEFFIPLVFYAFFWLNFFLIFPRNWGSLEYQRSPEQTLAEAVPAATHLRLKVGSFSLLACWLVILASIRHSLQHYQPRNRGIVNRALGILRMTPLRFKLLLPLALAIVAYQALVPWMFENSPMNIKGNVAAIYAGGYTPTLLIIYIQIISGFLRPNEDLELIRQRRERGIEEDERLRITRKPAWWRRTRPDAAPLGESMADRVARNARAVGGRSPGQNESQWEAEMRATDLVGHRAVPSASGAAAANTVEMDAMQRRRSSDSNGAGSLPSPRLTADAASSLAPARPMLEPYTGRSDQRRNERTVQTVAGLLFPNPATSPSPADRRAELMTDGPPPPPYQEPRRARESSERSISSAASINQPPQHVRSMLDV